MMYMVSPAGHVLLFVYIMVSSIFGKVKDLYTTMPPPGTPKGIKQLDALITVYGIRPLAKRLKIHVGSIQHAVRRGQIQPGLALKLYREFDISLKDLGH